MDDAAALGLELARAAEHRERALGAEPAEFLGKRIGSGQWW
jgi:hypothetical protein